MTAPPDQYVTTREIVGPEGDDRDVWTRAAHLADARRIADALVDKHSLEPITREDPSRDPIVDDWSFFNAVIPFSQWVAEGAGYRCSVTVAHDFKPYQILASPALVTSGLNMSHLSFARQSQLLPGRVFPLRECRRGVMTMRHNLEDLKAGHVVRVELAPG